MCVTTGFIIIRLLSDIDSTNANSYIFFIQINTAIKRIIFHKNHHRLQK